MYKYEICVRFHEDCENPKITKLYGCFKSKYNAIFEAGGNGIQILTISSNSSLNKKNLEKELKGIGLVYFQRVKD